MRFLVGLVAYGLFVTAVLGAEPAPDITLRTADGEFRLSEQGGKVVVLYFSTPG